MLAFFFLKKNRCLCWLPCWDVSQKWETHDCKLEERPYHKVTENLVTLCSRLHGLQEGRVCKRRSCLRKSQGKGWMSGLVCGFVCFCYCFLSICSKIPEERNGFSQNGSSKKKPTESLEKWEGLGQGESTRCVYDQGARKHVSQPPHVVQGPPQRQLRIHHSCSSHQTPRGQRARLQGVISKLGNSNCGPDFIPALCWLILQLPKWSSLGPRVAHATPNKAVGVWMLPLRVQDTLKSQRHWTPEGGVELM